MVNLKHFALAAAVLFCLSISNIASCDDSPNSHPSPSALEAMHMLGSEDPYQRQLGFLRLEALRELSTVETIKKYAQSKDPDTRASSLRAVAAIEGASSIPFLVDKLRAEKHHRVRRSILLALEPLGTADPQLLSVFIKSLRDSGTDVRMAAVDIVSRINDPKARDAIRNRAKRETRRDVRRVLKLALKRLGG